MVNVTDIEQLSASEITQNQGRDLQGIRLYQRPLTLEEQSLQDLRYALRHDVDIIGFEISPQSILITFKNDKSETVNIQSFRFHPKELNLSHIHTSHKRNNRAVIIPFGKEILPNEEFSIELRLAQTWEISDLQRIKGEMGYLYIDFIYNGQTIDVQKSI